MKKAIIFISVFILTVTTVIIANAHIYGFKVYNDSNGNVKIEWTTSYESDVTSFILQRKTVQTDWITVKTFDPHGPGLYSYTDYAAFKTTDVTFVYRLGVESSNNDIAYLDQSSISLKTTGFKQTWGMIKAMFR